MRDLKLVMDKVVNLVPDDDSRKQALIHETKLIKDSLDYAAPEMQSYWWAVFVDYLGSIFPQINTPWLTNIQNVMANSSICLDCGVDTSFQDHADGCSAR